MARLRVFESISLDGYFTDANGDMGWAHSARADAEYNDWVAANAGSGGELLFGRKTYDFMASFWPTPLAARQMPEVAKGMNRMKKHVATRAKSVTSKWENTHLLAGGLVPAVRKLKSKAKTDVTILGSGSVAAQLGEAGLVDEYQFVIVPVALGAGRTVFSSHCELKLLEHRAFRCGHVVVTYAT